MEVALRKKPIVRARKPAAPVAIPLSSIVAGGDCDPVHDRAVSWMAKKARLEAMIRQWQSLESILHAKTRRDITFDKACDSDQPEACAMRILNKRIEATYPELEKEAEAISALPTMSAEGALAKIELGLAVQGPFDWRDHALELVEEGLKDLREMIGLEGAESAPAHHEIGGF